jgi:hypothetical protein
MVVAAMSANPIVMVTGVGPVVIVPIVSASGTSGTGDALLRSRRAGSQAVVWDGRQAGPIWPPAESDPNGGLAMTVRGILPILPLAVDRLMRLGSSRESRTGRDWRSRGSPWSVGAPPVPVHAHAHALDPVDGCGDNRRA